MTVKSKIANFQKKYQYTEDCQTSKTFWNFVSWKLIFIIKFVSLLIQGNQVDQVRLQQDWTKSCTEDSFGIAGQTSHETQKGINVSGNQ